MRSVSYGDSGGSEGSGGEAQVAKETRSGELRNCGGDICEATVKLSRFTDFPLDECVVSSDVVAASRGGVLEDAREANLNSVVPVMSAG